MRRGLLLPPLGLLALIWGVAFTLWGFALVDLGGERRCVFYTLREADHPGIMAAISHDGGCSWDLDAQVESGALQEICHDNQDEGEKPNHR